MVHPEDIEGREFFVGLHGYDRVEVDTFLSELAAAQRALLEEIEDLRSRPPERVEVPVERDLFEELGDNVTAVLRTANESAASLREEAERYAEQARREVDDEIARLRGDAERHVVSVRAEAEAYAAQVCSEADDVALTVRVEADGYAEQILQAAEAAAVAERGKAEADVARARAQADELRSEAERLAVEARAEATRLVAEARAEQQRLLAEAEAHGAEVEFEAERRGRARAIATADDVVARLTDANRRHEELRHRLAEANDEIQLALLALGDPIADAARAVTDSVEEVVELETMVGSVAAADR